MFAQDVCTRANKIPRLDFNNSDRMTQCSAAVISRFRLAAIPVGRATEVSVNSKATTLPLIGLELADLMSKRHIIYREYFRKVRGISPYNLTINNVTCGTEVAVKNMETTVG